MRVSPTIQRWLTGPKSDPSIRARFWTDVAGLPQSDRRVSSATRLIGQKGWAAFLLRQQSPDGHWVTPKSRGEDLYWPKYVATNWVMIVLGDLGMTRKDPRVRRSAELMLAKWGARGWPLSGGRGTETCVTGNAVRTLIRFGYLEHPAVQRSIDWIVRAQKADGGWHCFPSQRGTLDAWEGLAALAEIPVLSRSGAVRRSIERGAEFFLRRKLMKEGGERYDPWLRIHYPHHYFYDVLVGLRWLVRLGYSDDPRLKPATEWLRNKRRPDGAWALDAPNPEYSPALGRLFPRPVFPIVLELPAIRSQWATVDALSVLSHVDGA